LRKCVRCGVGGLVCARSASGRPARTAGDRRANARNRCLGLSGRRPSERGAGAGTPRTCPHELTNSPASEKFEDRSKKRVGADSWRCQTSYMNDYERVARVIRFLDRHHTEQPDLNTLAATAELSPFHFHRLFSTWAGVTPKDFLQCLTVEHVKRLLLNRHNVFDAALDAGLSGPGRLHDLCVTLEAASPGEVKSGGAGMQVDYGFAESPFGEVLAAKAKRGICHLSFVDAKGRSAARDLLLSQWPNATLNRRDSRIAELVGTIFV